MNPDYISPALALPMAAVLWGYLIGDGIRRRRSQPEGSTVRTIVIAKTKAEGKKRFPHAVAIITPGSPDGARGIEADRVVVLRSMDNHPKVIELRESAAASLATTGGAVDGEPETPAEPTHVAGQSAPPQGSVPTPASPALIPPQA